jgi:hypothetical protein
MTGSAKQSNARHNGWISCFVASVLAMTAQHDKVHWNSRPFRIARKIFFIIFVDGMFTSFVARLFTNTSDAFDGIRAISCV